MEGIGGDVPGRGREREVRARGGPGKARRKREGPAVHLRSRFHLMMV